MIESEPNTPTMVVKRNGKRNGNHKERRQDELIVSIDDGEGDQVGEQNYQLGRDYIDQDGADKEALFPLENHPA
jgi:hypothetical protein